MENKKVCKNCGKELTKSAKKCKYCNTPCDSPKKQVIKFAKVFLVILIAFFVYKLITHFINIGVSNNLSIIWNSVVNSCSPYIFAALVILIIIGTLMGNVICGAILFIIFLTAIFQWLYQHWIPISVILGLVFLAILGNSSNERIEEKNNDKKGSSQEPKDYRKGNCSGMTKDYAIVVYKSDNPESTEKLFYEFKLWAPHVKNAPKTISVKGKNPLNVYTATYLEYKIISEIDYNHSSIPDARDYSAYSK